MPFYKARAPALPLPPVEYLQAQQDQFQNALRLYFNRLDDYLINLAGKSGGSLLNFPYVAATDSANQYADGDDTPTLVRWDTAESINGFLLNVDGSATCLYSGVFKITYRLQLVNTDTSEHTAFVWLDLNNLQLAKSTTAFTLPKAATVDSFIPAYSEVVFEASAGDEVRLYWATDQAATSGGVNGVYIYAEPAQVTPYPRPSIPSALGSITFVSALNQ